MISTTTTQKTAPTSKPWRARAVATTTGAALIGAAIFGATAASAAGPSSSPAAGPSSSAAAGTPAAKGSAAPARQHAKNTFGRHLSREFRVDIQAKDNLGDRAHVLAYALISHPKAFAKLPQNLQTDLKALEGAAAADRNADALNIKNTALNGGYGDKIQKRAHAIQIRISRARISQSVAPAKP